MSGDAIGLDIGGANLKAATASGQALCRPFELWRHPDRLAEELTHFRTAWPDVLDVAVTMTGELCDCFHTKRDGVRHILAATRAAFSNHGLKIWTTQGLMSSEQFADQNPLLAAAANWYALAVYAGRIAPSGAALLIDTGSTTTDIIPLWNGRPDPVGRTDPERLQSGELVYTGVRRTPVCALLQEGVAAEWFATTHDVHVILGHLPEEPENRSTADSRPMTRSHAHARLARMLGGDSELTSVGETEALARRTFAEQSRLIVREIDRVVARLPETPRTVIVSGSGAFLARTSWEDFFRLFPFPPVEVLSLSDALGPALSEAACAHALAVLTAEAAACD